MQGVQLMSDTQLWWTEDKDPTYGALINLNLQRGDQYLCFAFDAQGNVYRREAYSDAEIDYSAVDLQEFVAALTGETRKPSRGTFERGSIEELTWQEYKDEHSDRKLGDVIELTFAAADEGVAIVFDVTGQMYLPENYNSKLEPEQFNPISPNEMVNLLEELGSVR